MRVKTTVVCLPVTDLQRSLGFYRAFLERDDAKADGDTIVLELPNLSLFLMQRDGFEAYSRKAGRTALLPGADAPAIISCAVETREDVDRALERAQGHGGSHAGQPALDPAWGGYIGYATDPDGHLWEIVCPHQA